MFGKDYTKSKYVTQFDCMPYMIVAIHRLGGSDHGIKIVNATAKLMEISEEYKNRVSGKDPKGNDRYHFDLQVRWAMSQLKKAGYLKPTIETPNGHWGLSLKGEDLVKKLLKNINDEKCTDKLINEMKENNKKRKGIRKKLSEKSENSDEEFEQILELADDEINFEEDDIEQDLEKICKMDPYEFERVCIKLIKSMGGDLKETKKSGDGGIDGEGFIDTGLIRFRVVLQVKRYQRGNNVNETLISAFLGAKEKFNADKGIFITTSSFSKGAIELADEKSIKLIDGYELVPLMRKHEVGYAKTIDLR